MFDTALSGFRDLLPWLFGLSILMFVGGLIVLPILIVRMPRDYFLEHRSGSFREQHPVLRAGLLVLKNLIGMLLCGAGVIMLFTPGQGILALVVGISLLDVPGKRRLELALIRRPTVLKAINTIRKRFGREALLLPPVGSEDDDDRVSSEVSDQPVGGKQT